MPVLKVRRALVSKGYTHVDIVFSPSHDHWIKSKCNKKGGIHKDIHPTHKERAALFTQLVQSLKTNHHITPKEAPHIQTTSIEENDTSDWPQIYAKFAAQAKYKQSIVIYFCGADVGLSQKPKHLLVLKRNEDTSMSSSNIIEDKHNSASKLKAMVPEYVDFLSQQKGFDKLAHLK